MSKEFKRKLALFLLEGILVLSVIPIVSAIYHFAKGCFA